MGQPAFKVTSSGTKVINPTLTTAASFVAALTAASVASAVAHTNLLAPAAALAPAALATRAARLAAAAALGTSHRRDHAPRGSKLLRRGRLRQLGPWKHLHRGYPLCLMRDRMPSALDLWHLRIRPHGQQPMRRPG